jgi:tRNA(fMet)-specific endonuclease VapC
LIRYLLDTNICIEIIRGRSAVIFDKLRPCAKGEVGISAIVLAELEHGVEKSSHPNQNRIALDKFCAPLTVLAFDDAAAGAYGKIRADLERAGQTIGAMDMLIAAHALAENAVLVTNNEREFRRVEGLAIENWIV